MKNNTIIRILDSLRARQHETEWLEFKVNFADENAIGEYISALANSACLHNEKYGYLVFGIENSTHHVVGTTFKPKQQKIGNEELENWLLHHLNPRVDFKIYEIDYQEKHVAMFQIDAAHHTPINFKHTEYIRVGSYKKKLRDHPEKARKIWTKTSVQAVEKQIAMKDVSTDKVLELIDYPSYFHLLKINLPTNKTAIIEKLIEEEFIVNTKDNYSITNLGAILFARDLSKFSGLIRKAVRVVEYEGKGRLKTIKEQEDSKGYAIGFEGLIEYINSRLPVHEEIGDAFRKEKRVYPKLAIRELVANAIIHQDFNQTGTSPMVEIFSDRVEITNAGKPLIDPLRFIDHHPKSRNEILARFMRRINICEERGSGIDKVVFETEINQLPAPDFHDDESFFRATLFSFRTLRQMDKIEKSWACYLHCCLKFVSKEYMTNQSLRERFNVSEKNYSTVSRIIGETIDKGLIKDFDVENKSKKYKKYIPFWA